MSIDSLACSMSHSACKSVIGSVLRQRFNSATDTRAIGDLVRANSVDLLQADHTLSGIDMALQDLLGQRYEKPVWSLLGHGRSCAKTPYASVLFGDNAQETLIKAQGIRARLSRR